MRRRVIVHGSVQGVGFRYAVRRAAAARGLSGWIRNRPDGTVEAVFEGDPAAVERLVRFCREGPGGAEVDRIELADEAPQGFRGFEIR